MKKALFAIAVVVCFAPVLGISEAQPPASDDPKPARDAVVELTKRLFPPRSSKDLSDAMAELEEVAEMLRTKGPRLEIYLRNKKPEVKQRALSTIAAINYPTAHLAVADLLVDSDEETRAQAARALSRLTPNRNAINNLVEMTKHKNPSIRQAAISALGKYGQYYSQARPPVIAALADGEPIAKGSITSPQSTALSAIRFWGPEGKEAVPRLIQLFRETGDHSLKASALHSVAIFAPEDPIVMDTSRKWLKSPDNFNERLAGAGILGVLGSGAKEAVPDLVAAFQKTDVKDKALEMRIKGTVLNVLKNMGPDAKDAIPALESEATAATDAYLRGEIRRALDGIRGKK